MKTPTQNKEARGDAPDGEKTNGEDQQLASDILGGQDTLRLASSSFDESGRIPLRFSDYGQGISPALHWSMGPPGTQSYALIVEDPDAPKPHPVVHWLLFNIPSRTTRLAEAVPGVPTLGEPKGAEQGMNTHGITGYSGPRPPGADPHRYHFQLFALDSRLDLRSGVSRDDLIAAMRGHVLARGEAIGSFQKPEGAEQQS